MGLKLLNYILKKVIFRDRNSEWVLEKRNVRV